jgi:hypothetical protein
MSECTVEQNKEKCNCTYEPCCECIRYHWRSCELPACFFPDDIERTYDRSIERFIETYQKRGRL